MKRFIGFGLIAFVAVTVIAAPAHARSFIRDTEIEAILQAYATPVFRAAGLDAQSVQIYIVNDPALNAFVAGGQRIFINTGTIDRAATPEELIGVIAHESGHIAGAHLSRTQRALETAQVTTILGQVAAVAAAVASGRGDVGAAVAAGGIGAGLGSIFSYSRVQESAADQAAMRYLDQAGISSAGLLNFMRVLQDQELVSSSRQDPYLRTHPFARNRVEALQAHVAQSPLTASRLPERYYENHARMRAKLFAYQNSLTRTLRQYPEEDPSIAARYARAVAYARLPDFDKAGIELAFLNGAEPENPYFHEVKGQMLLEGGDAVAAIEPLQTAADLVPWAPLIRTMLAHAQIESGDPDLLEPAQANLVAALSRERRSAQSWRFLAIAYGRDGHKTLASYAQAEYALLRGDREIAVFHACQAMRNLRTGDPTWLRVQDILNALSEGRDDPVVCR